MLAISLLPVLLALPELATAGPFTFPAQPSLRHVTLTAQDGQHLVLTITQTQTATTTMTQTPTTIQAPSGPRRTGRPGEEAELELRDDVFAPTTDSDSSSDSSAGSDSTTSPSSSSSSTEEDSSDEPAAAAAAQVQTVAKAQTTPPPPKDDPQVASALAQQGYSQVTYYSCATRDATLTHCGWHVPVVKVSGATSWRNGSDMGRIVGAALATAFGVVLGSLVM